LTVRSLLPAIQLSIRAALAAAFSVAIGNAIPARNPLYVMISAVLVIDLSPAETRKLALPRFAGTLLGAAIGALLSQVMRSSSLEIGVGVLAAMLLAHLLRLQGAARLAGFLCGIVMLNYGDAPWTYAYHRILDTGLGIALAVLVSFVPKLIPAGERNS
jgi:uncharacterized membrane protein YgaE (UPF0421/DUF939 family)